MVRVFFWAVFWEVSASGLRVFGVGVGSFGVKWWCLWPGGVGGGLVVCLLVLIWGFRFSELW